MSAETAALILGGVLVVAGLGLTLYQLVQTSGKSGSRSMTINRKGVSLKTTFPGLVITVLGVVLVAVVAS